MSPFHVVLDASLRATPVLGLVLLFCVLRPRSAPGLRHLALTVGLLAFLAIPLLRLALPEWALPVPAAAAPWVHAGVLSPSPRPEVPPSGIGIVILVWAAGVLLLLARVLVGLAGVARLGSKVRAAGRVAPGHGGGRVRVLVTGAVDVPVTIGFIRPAVLLPAAAVAWTARERRAVVLHELAHVRRGDAWTLLLAALVQAVHWPNPLVWLAARHLRAASEEACDAAVVAAGTHPLVYAQILLDLARRGGRRPPRLAPGIAPRGGLSRRLERLLRGGARPSRPVHGVLLAAALALLVGSAAAARPALSLEKAARFYAGRFGIGEALSERILTAAAAERVHPDLAFGLVAVESGFDPHRTSPRGAVGLTQLLPSTAAQLQPGITPELLRDSDVNLRLGFRLLHGNLRHFSGDRERALLAYAVGPAQAARPDALGRSTYPCRVLRTAARSPGADC